MATNHTFVQAISAGQRLTTPTGGGTMVSFFTPTQRQFRDQYKGFFAQNPTGAHAPVRVLTKLPTGAATMQSLEPDTTLYRAVLGDWGRPTRAGRR